MNEKLQKHLESLDFKPIEESFPWEYDSFDDEKNRPIMPVGIVLKRISGEITIIGDNVSGERTAGCDCCSVDWNHCLTRNYSQWAWLVQ